MGGEDIGRIVCTSFIGVGWSATAFDGVNRFIRISDIDNKTHAYSCACAVSPCGALSDKFLVGEGDILLARTGSTVGKSYLYQTRDGKLYFANNLIRAHVLVHDFAAFIYAHTFSARYTRWIKETARRSVQPSLNIQQFASYALSLPCLAEQRKITSLLQAVASVVALQEAELSLCEAQLKGMKQQLLTARLRFRNADSSPYPQWLSKSTRKLCAHMRVGATPDTKHKEYYQGSIPWITVGDLDRDDIYKVRSHKCISEEAAEASYATKLPRGSIVVVIRAGVGKVAILSRESCTSHNCVGLEGIMGDVRFVAYLLSQRMQQEAHYAYGTTILGLNLGWFKALRHSVPAALSEQRKIADCLDCLKAVVLQQRAELASWRMLLRGLRQQIFA